MIPVTPLRFKDIPDGLHFDTWGTHSSPRHSKSNNITNSTHENHANLRIESNCSQSGRAAVAVAVAVAHQPGNCSDTTQIWQIARQCVAAEVKLVHAKRSCHVGEWHIPVCWRATAISTSLERSWAANTLLSKNMTSHLSRPSQGKYGIKLYHFKVHNIARVT